MMKKIKEFLVDWGLALVIAVLGILMLLFFSSISANEKYDIYTKLLFITVVVLLVISEIVDGLSRRTEKGRRTAICAIIFGLVFPVCILVWHDETGIMISGTYLWYAILKLISYAVYKIAKENRQIVTVSEMKALEKAADEAGLSYLEMMENAGQRVVDLMADLRLIGKNRAWVFCGKGNNGGDGFVAARLLAERGMDVKVILVEGEPVTKDAGINYDRIVGMVDIIKLDESSDIKTIMSELKEGNVVIDAIYGTGFHGTPSDNAAKLIDFINSNRYRERVISVDIPSGLPGDGFTESKADNSNETHSNNPVDKAVHADYTVIFHARKPIHVSKSFEIRDMFGSKKIVDIGISKALKQK